jgi:hypothetical protein
MLEARFSVKVQARAIGIGNQQAATFQQPHDAPTQAVEQPDDVVPLRAPRAVEDGPDLLRIYSREPILGMLPFSVANRYC